MPKNRLEAFSDGVIAIVITLLVLEIHVPQLPESVSSHDLIRMLLSLAPNFVAYIISFLVCAVWWVSHHNFIHDLKQVNRPLLWANNLFLLWLVFIPFPTALLGQHPGQPVATAFYGIICSLTGCSFWLMRRYASLHGELMKAEISDADRRHRVRVSMFSPLLYLVGAICSLALPTLAICIYAVIPAYFAIANLAGAASSGTEE